MVQHYDYLQATSRNIGWVTETEQLFLRTRKIAIAGMGGVGGAHLLTLTRLGIGKFHLADFDHCELANFNRQAVASCSRLGTPKLESMMTLALDINPELQIRSFSEGVNEENLERFLEGVDLYIDGLDFFVLPIRRKIFAYCHAHGIPAITAAPLGMGVAALVFLPNKMSFEQYFCLEGCSEQEQYYRFMAGLSPSMLQRNYLIQPDAVNFLQQKGPSTVMACELCAGVAATEALKVLLHRGDLKAAPWGVHFDAYRQQYRHTWRPGGNRNPIQQVMLGLLRRLLSGRSAVKPALELENLPLSLPTSEEALLPWLISQARWAPSGDNAQPWRFRIIGPRRLSLEVTDTRAHCLYDLQGHASWMATGAMLESLQIAASRLKLGLQIEWRTSASEINQADILLIPEESLEPDPLFEYLPIRSVQRKPFSRQPLRVAQKRWIEQQLPAGYRVHWLESSSLRWQMVKIWWQTAGLRLNLPEAYSTHRDVIDWDQQFSRTKVPDQALGASPLLLKLMRPILKNWKTVEFFNKYLAGTLLPRLQMDVLPAWSCATHFLIEAPKPLDNFTEYLQAGRALQRFWLSCTRQDLQLQPCMTPLIFNEYLNQAVSFTQDPDSQRRASELQGSLRRTLGEDVVNSAVFMGRIGVAPLAASRSIRYKIETLLALSR